MKLISYFKEFLKKEVNLNPDRIQQLDSRTESITTVLKESDLLTNNFISVIPQGSYAHKTIIKPVKENDEFDADVLLFVEEFKDWEAQDYVEKVYSLFKENSVYKDKVHRKTRCITIDYANDFHIDIVPFLERHENKYVTNRHENRFELTNPEEYTIWLDDKNRITKHHLVKVIRLIKYLRDSKRTFTIKSIILNTLLAQQVSEAALLEDQNCYADIPTTFNTIMKRLKEYVSNNYYLPVIKDPSNTGENFSDRWDQEGWLNFRGKIIYYSDKISEAFEESDIDKSLEKWQFIFGDQFKKPIENNSELIKTSQNPAGLDQTEQQIADLGINERIVSKYKVRLNGRVKQKPGFRNYLLSSYGNKVNTGRDIIFSMTCNVPKPYKIYWKVLNRGKAAAELNCRRGQIIEGTESHSEITSFRGNHFVECYIVKDGECVAKDRQTVTIV